MRLLLLAALLLPLAACADADDPTPVVVTDPDPVDPAPIDTIQPDGIAYRIESAQPGDAACYLELTPEAGGAAETLPAAFEVCDQIEAEGLTGQVVTLQMEEGQMMAASCQGDPACTDSETVQMVTTVTAMPTDS